MGRKGLQYFENCHVLYTNVLPECSVTLALYVRLCRNNTSTYLYGMMIRVAYRMVRGGTISTTAIVTVIRIARLLVGSLFSNVLKKKYSILLVMEKQHEAASVYAIQETRRRVPVQKVNAGVRCNKMHCGHVWLAPVNYSSLYTFTATVHEIKTTFALQESNCSGSSELGTEMYRSQPS